MQHPVIQVAPSPTLWDPTLTSLTTTINPSCPTDAGIVPVFFPGGPLHHSARSSYPVQQSYRCSRLLILPHISTPPSYHRRQALISFNLIILVAALINTLHLPLFSLFCVSQQSANFAPLSHHTIH